jgi:hypothetical protein
MKLNVRLQPEVILSLIAIVISLFSVVATFYQVELMRKEQNTAVWPYLEFLPSTLGGLSLTVENKGVGPAIVHSVYLKYNGKPIEAESERAGLLTLIDSVVGRRDLDFIYSTVNRRVISPGEEIQLFYFPDTLQDFVPVATAFAEANIDLEICYCSIYDECWISRGVEVEPCTSCP